MGNPLAGKGLNVLYTTGVSRLFYVKFYAFFLFTSSLYCIFPQPRPKGLSSSLPSRSKDGKKRGPGNEVVERTLQMITIQ